MGLVCLEYSHFAGSTCAVCQAEVIAAKITAARLNTNLVFIRSRASVWHGSKPGAMGRNSKLHHYPINRGPGATAITRKRNTARIGRGQARVRKRDQAGLAG